MPGSRTHSSGPIEDRAFALARHHLGADEPGVTVADDGKRAEFAIYGVNFAVVERAGRSVVATFLVSELDRSSVSSLVGYAPDPIREGWWKIRLGTEPRRWRESLVAELSGRMLSTLRTTSLLGQWPAIDAESSHFALAPSHLAARWASLRVTVPSTEFGLVETEEGTALLTRARGPLRIRHIDGGALLVQDLAKPSRPEYEVREIVSRLSTSEFAAAGLTLDVDGPLAAFDASRESSSTGEGGVLTLDLARGCYEVAYADARRTGCDLFAICLTLRSPVGDRSADADRDS